MRVRLAKGLRPFAKCADMRRREAALKEMGFDAKGRPVTEKAKREVRLARLREEHFTARGLARYMTI